MSSVIHNDYPLDKPATTIDVSHAVRAICATLDGVASKSDRVHGSFDTNVNVNSSVKERHIKRFMFASDDGMVITVKADMVGFLHDPNAYMQVIVDDVAKARDQALANRQEKTKIILDASKVLQ